MARKSTVDKARDEVRDLINRMLRDNRMTLDEMKDVLDEQFPDEQVPSRTALHRYKKGFAEIMRSHRQIESASQALVAELGENFDDRSGALLAQAVTTLATRATHDALGDEATDIGDVLDLTRAAKYAQEARALSRKERIAVAKDAREQQLKEQEQRLEEMRGSDGMSEQFEDRIRRILLGKS
ncbi:phage protein Gp27 family protein [Phytopseudomonas daroniae]|uniref:phage protein Gp27 family protein n=1 Tax=Phytopseudomonas daroniae TaxID=2487519 RepID=UPI001038581C|nr:phage protein Gp27 family protein [Pseudomonas daroniae]TBU75210.1 small terminase subunit [Pseudomonas daroniae]